MLLRWASLRASAMSAVTNDGVIRLKGQLFPEDRH